MSVDTQKRFRIMGTHRQLQAEIAQARGTLEQLINDSAPFDDIVEQSKELVLAEAASDSSVGRAPYSRGTVLIWVASLGFKVFIFCRSTSSTAAASM